MRWLWRSDSLFSLSLSLFLSLFQFRALFYIRAENGKLTSANLLSGHSQKAHRDSRGRATGPREFYGPDLFHVVWFSVLGRPVQRQTQSSGPIARSRNLTEISRSNVWLQDVCKIAIISFSYSKRQPREARKGPFESPVSMCYWRSGRWFRWTNHTSNDPVRLSGDLNSRRGWAIDRLNPWEPRM